MHAQPATLARPDLQPHERAVRTPLPDLVRELVGLIGKKLTAYVGGVKDTRTVDGWINRAQPYGDDTERRLRCAFHVAAFLAQYDAPPVIQAWLTGLNPQLGDRSPLQLLRDGTPEEEGRAVLAAARAFAVGG